MFSSIQPLKTHPNPPSPSRLSVRKFFVAFLRSLKVNDLTVLETDVSTLAGTEPPNGVSCDDAVESDLALLLGFVLSER